MPIVQSLVNLCLMLAILAAAPALGADSGRRDKVSFYFAAHQDDWQLTMNPSAFNDVTGGAAKTVFVHLTAGDAGLGAGSGGRKHPYYLARENGAKTAIRFMADVDTTPTAEIAARPSFNGHAIYRVNYRNTVSYFLRVPDGNMPGTGYKKTGYQSLKRLADGDNNVLSAVDQSTVYKGWNDLVLTLRKILDFERGRAPRVQLNVAEIDERSNPDDHSDHLMTAKAALDAAKDLTCAQRVYFVDYAIAKRPENLDVVQRDMESAVYAVTVAGILAFDHRSEWRSHQIYVGRSYFRVEEGTGPCDANTTGIKRTR
jgi:hypothetical protein